MINSSMVFFFSTRVTYNINILPRKDIMLWRQHFTNSTSTVYLDFLICDTPVAQTWASLYETDLIYSVIQDQIQTVCHSWPLFKLNHQSLLSQACLDVGITPPDSFDQLSLNHLHNLFQCWEESKIETSEEDTAIWQQINRSIHALESENNYCVWRVGPSTQVPITDSLRTGFVNAQIAEPHLTLGYNTIGKNLLHVFNNNDIQLVKDGGVRPQEYIGTEVTFNITYDTTDRVPAVHKWVIDNELSVNLAEPANQYLHQPVVAILVTPITILELVNLVMTYNFTYAQKINL